MYSNASRSVFVDRRCLYLAIWQESCRRWVFLHPMFALKICMHPAGPLHCFFHSKTITSYTLSHSTTYCPALSLSLKTHFCIWVVSIWRLAILLLLYMELWMHWSLQAFVDETTRDWWIYNATSRTASIQVATDWVATQTERLWLFFIERRSFWISSAGWGSFRNEVAFERSHGNWWREWNTASGARRNSPVDDLVGTFGNSNQAMASDLQHSRRHRFVAMRGQWQSLGQQQSAWSA